MRYIKQIEVENFKSFQARKHFDFGNYDDLKLIFDRDPTGNSVDLLDAVSFVLDHDSMKTKRLSDLIHKSESENAPACVTLCCVTDDNGEVQFTRIISNNYRGYFQINRKIVTKKEYVDRLHVLELNSADSYCLVVEGAAVLFSLKSREQKTEIFEVMNGSSSLELQQQVQHLISEIRECERNVLQEKIKHYLLRFFHSEKHKLELEKDVEEKNRMLVEFKENSIKEMTELGIKETALKNLEKKIKKGDLNVVDRRKKYAKTQALVKLGQEQLNSASKPHEELKSDISNHKSMIDQLNRSIEDRKLQLSQLKKENKMPEYEHLKKQAEKSTSKSFQKLNDLLKFKSTLQIDGDSTKSKDAETNSAPAQINLQLSESNAMPGHKRKRSEVETEANKRFSTEEETFANKKDVNVQEIEKVNADIAEVDNDIKRVEEKLFKGFCQSQGVKNLQEFEIDYFTRSQKKYKKEIELKNEIQKLKIRLDFATSASVESEGIVDAAKYKLESYEKELIAISNKEKKRTQELNKIVGEFEDMTKRRYVIKTEILDLKCKMLERDSEMNDTRVRKKVVILEIKEIRKQRHQLLIECKEQKVKLVFRNGNWDDIYYSAYKWHSKYSMEDDITFDFSSLEPNLKQLNSKDVLGSNFEQLENLVKRAETDGASAASGQHDLKSLKLELKNVKSQRVQLFMNIFEHVNGCVDRIYKELTKCGNANATLILEDANEPYVDGIKYEFAAPSKGLKLMSEMPIEEGYVAAMALLVSIQTFHNLPEDKEENDENIKKLSDYLQKKN